MPAVVAGAILGAGEEMGQELPSMGVLESAFGSRMVAQVLWVTLTLLSSKFTGATFSWMSAVTLTLEWLYWFSFDTISWLVVFNIKLKQIG